MRLSRGFSYIEILVTLAILALLASAALPYLELVSVRQKESMLRHDLREVREALDAYRKAAEDGRILRQAGDSGYPKRLEDLVSGMEDLKDPLRRKIYFLRRLPRDPMTPVEEANPAMTWGKRSYESPPEDPREGSDVFDIFSKSQQKGLNGIPYNQW